MDNVYHFSELLSDDGFLFKIERFVLTEDYEAHSHDFSELVLILGGSGEHLINKELYPVKKGDVYLLKGNTSHGFRQVDSLGMCNIQFDLEQLELPLSRLKKLIGFQSLFIVEPEYRQHYTHKQFLNLNDGQLEQIDHLTTIMNIRKEDRELKRWFWDILYSVWSSLLVGIRRIINRQTCRCPGWHARSSISKPIMLKK